MKTWRGRICHLTFITRKPTACVEDWRLIPYGGISGMGGPRQGPSIRRYSSKRQWFIQEGLCLPPKFIFLLCSSTLPRITPLLGCRGRIITQGGRRLSPCPLLLGSHTAHHILHQTL